MSLFGNGFLNWGAFNTPSYGMANPLGISTPNTVGNVANTIGNLNLGNSGTGGWFNTLFGDNKAGLLSTLGGLGMGIMQGFTGLQQLGLANRALNLANKQFGFQTALANRNLANQAKIINNTYDSAAAAAAGLIGGKDANGRRGFADPTVSKMYADYAKTKHVDGSSIG